MEIAGLYVETHGSAHSPAVLLSSGLGGSAGYWAPNIPALAECFFVIAYDQRGTGRSGRKLPEDLCIRHMADDVLMVLDGLSVPKAHLIGHALGAVIGLDLALRAPERLDRLMLVNGWARLLPHTSRCFDVRLRILRDSGPEAFYQAQPLFLYPANWIELNADYLEEEHQRSLSSFPGRTNVEARIGALQAFDALDRLGDIATPVLAYSVEDDLLVPSIASSRIIDRIPDRIAGTEVHGPWGGHACNLTDPDNFNEHAIAWLSGERLTSEEEE